MKRHSDPGAIPPEDRGAVCAIGNFDGVHLGHRATIDLARGIAEAEGAPLGVVTFEPHPRTYFAPDGPDFRLMTADARARRLASIDVERLYELPFGEALATQTPEAFARDVLAGQLGIAHAVIGADFRFGARRAGDAEALAALGRAHGFGVTTAPIVSLGTGGEVSSTAIREALTRGDPRAAAAMLGHLHRIEGEVIHGEKRGRTLGYPTANMALDGLHLPRFGVYAVRVDVLDGPHAGRHAGAASLGVRPHYGGGDAPNLETFLLDFDGDLYGARLSVGLQDYLRPEAAFDSEAAFLDQMAEDCAEARRRLA